MEWYEQLGLESEDALWCSTCDIFYDARFWEEMDLPIIQIIVKCPECLTPYTVTDLYAQTNKEVDRWLGRT